MKLAPGQEEELRYKEAGFSDSEIAEWKGKEISKYRAAGFSEQEVKAHFGEYEPDMTATKEFIQGNLSKLAAEKAAKATTSEGGAASAVPGHDTTADTFWEALQAGFQMSSIGLAVHGKMPDKVLPEHSDMALRIASGIGTLAGDVPAMAAGGIIGGLAGTPGGPVAVATAGAGSFALPEAIRQTLVQGYAKGEIKSFGDFWERASVVFLESLKSGVTGAATFGVGKVAKTVAGSAGVVAKTAPTMAEIATMTTVGKAMEGEVPTASDFLEAAAVVGVAKGAFYGGGKAIGATVEFTAPIADQLREIYAKTGRHPKEVAMEARDNPVALQDLLTEKPKAAEPAKPAETASEGAKPETTAELPKEAPPAHPIDERIVPHAKKAEKTSLKQRWDDFYTDAVDKLNPLKNLRDTLAGGKELPASKDPYVAARLNQGNFGKADYVLNFGPFKFETLEDTGTPGLARTLRPFRDDLNGFRRYMVAARVTELADQGIKTGFEVEGPKGTRVEYEAGKEKYDAAFREVVKLQNDMTDYLVDAGILKKEARDKMQALHKNFVPMFRLMEGESVKGATGKGLVVFNPVKGIKGSERPVLDPLESIVRNIHQYVQLGERNRVLTNLVELAEKHPEGSKLVQKVPTKVRPIEVETSEMGKFFEEHGLDPNDFAGESFTIFRPEAERLAKDEIAVYREGKREIYKVAPEVAEVLKGLDRETSHWLLKLASKPAQLARAGVTNSPDFLLRNVVRDQLSAFILSKNHYVPVLDYMMGLSELWAGKGRGTGEVYRNWLKAGGAQSEMSAIDRNYLEKSVHKLAKETGLIDMTWNVVKNPFELASVLQSISEQPTRLGEMRKGLKGKSDVDTVMKAAFDSRNVSLDFQRRGLQTKALSMLIPFFNPSIQGFDASMRALKERPVEFGLKATALITLPSVLLWMANKDDVRYQEIPRWQKDMFWIVPTDRWQPASERHANMFPESLRRKNGETGQWEVNTGPIYRIPKPQEAGLMFGSLVERTLDKFVSESPDAMKGFGETLTRLAPNVMPAFASPVLEQYSNKSFFTGGPVVPAYLEKMAPEYQYTNYTTDTAKALGKLIGFIPGVDEGEGLKLSSPMVLENYVQAWTGPVGKYTLQIADWGLRKSGVFPPKLKAEDTLADLAVVKAFSVRHPSMAAVSIRDFYEKHRKLEETMATFKGLAMQGDIENAMKEAKFGMENGTMFTLSGVKEALGTMAGLVRTIDRDPKMTPQDKRMLIDGVYYSMIKMAKLANKQIDRIQSLADEKKKAAESGQ